MPPLGGLHQIIAMLFGTEKREWWVYPTVKNVDDMFIRFDTIHKCDRQTDRQTLHDGTGCAYA